jgi:tetratricopeptide (TPR) repeat protein
MGEDDPLKRLFTWIAAAATLSFATMGLTAQNDPRLAELFDQLKAAPSAETAADAEQEIWSIWHLTGTEAIDRIMAIGMHTMSQRDFDRALQAFDTITERAPYFAEGWNKRATLFWLMGDYDASVSDIDRTLALEPRHFGALSGLSMIRSAQDRHLEALEALQRMLVVHPNSPGVQQRINQIEQLLGQET